MNEPIITNTEQAREFYIQYVHNCPRPSVDLDDAFTPETLNAYHEHSSSELELQWSLEKFLEYYSRIKPKNSDNLKLLKEAWRWHTECTPVKLVAEKLEIMMAESRGTPDEKLVDCVCSTAMWTHINKSDESEEQLLLRLMELCEPFVSEEQNERMRLKVVGPVSEEEAKRQYRINHFGDKPDYFQTYTAERGFHRFATPENMLKWKQEYFDEWTDKSYFLSKKDMGWVNVIELGGLYYGIYSRENLEKLYDKLSDYKHSAAADQYWDIAFHIVSNLSKRLFEDGEFELLERFYKLAENLLKDAPKSWEKDYFGKHTLKDIAEYRALMKEKNDGNGNGGKTRSLFDKIAGYLKKRNKQESRNG